MIAICKIDEETIFYLKKRAENKGVPYQSLINRYLLDCTLIYCEFKTS